MEKSTIRILQINNDLTTRNEVTHYLVDHQFHVENIEDVNDIHDIAENEFFDLLITDFDFFTSTQRPVCGFLRRKFYKKNILIARTQRAVKSKGEFDGIGIVVYKPLVMERLREAVENILEKKNVSFASHTDSNTPEHNLGLIGNSSYIRGLRQQIEKIASGDFPVLIQGGSGTGKEVVANAIHRCSTRHTHKIVTINCGAIPKHLEESEFFGYEKGAFTGAYKMKKGIIASAHNSTLFLDEIGETSLEIQAMLLRVLDTGEFIPIGMTEPLKVDIRIVSATNQNLEQKVKEGSFREDLYFRLKGMIITTKSLTEHIDDVQPLVEHFLSQQENDKVPRKISSKAIDLLKKYEWPGNIRELKYTVDVLCIASLGMNQIGPNSVRSVLKINDTTPAEQPTYSEAKANVLQEFETVYFTGLLHQFKGNVNQASKAAGMHRPNFIQKIKRLNISPDTFRPNK
jgi:two-component system NtrC family response regulator